MNRWCYTLLLLSVLALPVQAHFIWIVPAENHKSAQVVFSDELAPDDNVPVSKIAETKLFARGADNNVQALSWKKAGNAYQITLPPGAATVGGTCVYGVLAKGGAPFLLVYHPKSVLGPSPEKLRSAVGTHWSRQDLDIVLSQPAGGQGLCQGQVLWHGKPLPHAEVVIQLPGADETIKEKVNVRGQFTFPLPKQAGPVAIRARFEDEKEGVFQDHPYKLAKHYATLVVPAGALTATASAAAAGEEAPAGAKSVPEDPAASKLLKDARAARATWKDFPGFRADVELNHNGTIQRGKLTVSAAGKVELEGIENEADHKWAREQLRSLVAHRMDNASDRDTPCAFLDDNKHHPLGRAIRVLNDELHSSYRIRDRQIIEVFRQMGDKVRFKITVLKNHLTPEKKFLPTTYVVNTWNARTDQLISSMSFQEAWTRIGNYDLPATLLIVTARGAAPARAASAADDGGQSDLLDVRELRFRHYKLIEK